MGIQLDIVIQSKRLRIILDEKLNFKFHMDKVLTKTSKGVAVIKKTSKPFNCRIEGFKNSFFLYTIEAWYSLDPTIINSKSLEVFKSRL